MTEPTNHMDTIMNLEELQIDKPNFALIHAKLVRHITAASIQLRAGYKTAAEVELNEAMEAIKAFESPFLFARPCPPSS
jgi:hypothetical protein